MRDFAKDRKAAVEKAQRTLDGAGEQDDKKYGAGIEKRVKLREKVENLNEKEDKRDIRKIERAEDRVEKRDGDPKAQAALDAAVDSAIDLGGSGLAASRPLAGGAPGKARAIPLPDEPDQAPPAPGAYAAEGDPYKYQVDPDGSIKIALPQGGEAVVTADSPGTAYGAIMAQIRSGQLSMTDPAPTMAGAPELGSSEPAAPEGPPPVAGVDPLKDPSAERSRMRSEALARAYGE